MTLATIQLINPLDNISFKVSITMCSCYFLNYKSILTNLLFDAKLLESLAPFSQSTRGEMCVNFVNNKLTYKQKSHTQVRCHWHSSQRLLGCRYSAQKERSFESHIPYFIKNVQYRTILLHFNFFLWSHRFFRRGATVFAHNCDDIILGRERRSIVVERLSQSDGATSWVDIEFRCPTIGH